MRVGTCGTRSDSVRRYKADVRGGVEGGVVRATKQGTERRSCLGPFTFVPSCPALGVCRNLATCMHFVGGYNPAKLMPAAFH